MLTTRKTFALFVFLTLVNCWNASTLAAEQDLNVRPLTEATKGEAPALSEVSATDAILTFTSSIPLACTVVYGETKSYGMISNDPGMSGVATINHRPVLGGLKADTSYHFRVQGVAADGTVYVGRERTFHTKKAVKGAVDNLAALTRGATVAAVSSNWGGGPNDGAYGASSAFDESRTSEWSSFGDGNDAFIEIDLGGIKEIGAIEVWTRTMSDGTAQIFTFTVSTGEGKTFGPFRLPDAERPYSFTLEAKTDSLRLDAVETSGGNTGLVEFKVFGK